MRVDPTAWTTKVSATRCLLGPIRADLGAYASSCTTASSTAVAPSRCRAEGTPAATTTRSALAAADRFPPDLVATGVTFVGPVGAARSGSPTASSPSTCAPPSPRPAASGTASSAQRTTRRPIPRPTARSPARSRRSTTSGSTGPATTHRAHQAGPAPRRCRCSWRRATAARSGPTTTPWTVGPAHPRLLWRHLRGTRGCRRKSLRPWTGSSRRRSGRISKYKVTILNSPAINAFALPNGRLYVTRGLIALANDRADKLASVLGARDGSRDRQPRRKIPARTRSKQAAFISPRGQRRAQS